MNITYLKEFLDLANRLNYTDSANALHVHQSTLSKHILALEKEFGAEFFTRTAGTVTLTDEGYSFAGNAAKILDVYEQAKRDLEALKNPDMIYISWAVHDEGVVGLLSSAIVLNNSTDKTQVKFKNIPWSDLYKRLADDSIDAIIKTESKDFLTASGYEYRLLLDGPFVAIMEKDHPLATRKSLAINDLRGATLIKLIGEHAGVGWKIIELACQKRGFNPDTMPIFARTHVEQFTTPLGSSILIYPGTEREIKFLSKLNHHTIIPFGDEDATFSVYIIFKKENEERLEDFLEAIDQVRDLMNE